MRVLIVDDNTKKRNQLREEVQSATGEHAKIDVASSVQEAERKLTASTFDLMILDLNLPTRRGLPPQKTGGTELLRRLRQLAATRTITRPRYILAVSAYDDVIEEQRRLFQEEAVVLIPYSDDSVDWRQSIRNQVVQVAASLADCKALTSLCIVTALHKIELEAVLALPAGWKPINIEGDATNYYQGKFVRNGKALDVVAASATEMGMPASAALAMKMIFRFRPRVLAMAGIAAGFKGNFGDILVAYDSWDYGSGKRTGSSDQQSQFRPRPSYLPIDPELKNRLEAFSMEHDRTLREIRLDWNGEAPVGAPGVIAGPLGSGASVVADRAILEDLRNHNDKLIGVEMEAYGIFAACRGADAPRPAALVMKSTCDYGDASKDDRYQRYAAYTSACYLYEFALSKLDV